MHEVETGVRVRDLCDDDGAPLYALYSSAFTMALETYMKTSLHFSFKMFIPHKTNGMF